MAQTNPLDPSSIPHSMEDLVKLLKEELGPHGTLFFVCTMMLKDIKQGKERGAFPCPFLVLRESSRPNLICIANFHHPMGRILKK
jgi:hypothetical protein